jgi:ligand-binding sensor domain-containing protein
MSVRLLYIFLFLGLNTLITQAQHPYAWDLTVEDGLPSLEVYDLYQDSKGYMWIGTDKGLCKYNGNEFSYYQNKEDLSEALSGIQEDLEGRIWVRNFKDQIFYVEDDSLHYFEMPQKITIQDFLVDTEGAIWIIDRTKDSLYCYTDSGRWKSWEVYPAETTFRQHGLTSIVEGKDQSIYISSKCGLFEYRADSIRFITAKNLLQAASDSTILISLFLFKDKENTLFLLQNSKGYAYQVSQLIDDQIGIVWNFYRKTFQESKNHGLRVDENNTIWQLTLDAGLGPILNSSATSKLDSTLLLFPNGLLFPNEGISDFVIDREGSYWVSSLSKGVHIVPSLKIQKYTAANSIIKYDRVGLIEKKDKETLLIDTEQGVIFSYNTKENVIKDKIEVLKDKSKQLTWNKGKLLVNGLIYQKSYTRSSEYKPNIRNSIIYKKDWFLKIKSTGVALYHLTENIGSGKNSTRLFPYIKRNKNKKIGIRGKPLTMVSSFYGISDAENGRILIARDDSLVCYPEIETPFPILDENKETIRGIYMEKSPNGIIWVCTVNSGLYALNKDLKVIDHITIQEGLINNKIKKLKIDGDDLWLLSARGIQRFNPKTKESWIYTKEDGLPTHEIKDIAIVNNKIWLSTAKGLISFDKDLPSKNVVPPSIYLKRIAIHDKDRELKPLYNLNYRQNSLTIYVEGVAYRSRGNFQYKYRMLGIDSSWISQPSAINVMRFPQLNPGTYIFQVKAMNEDGVESNETIDVQFIIDKPYWQLWWAQGLFFLTIMLIIVAAVLTRVQNKQREEQQENAMNVLRMQALQSQMNPHFIFNVLTAVQNLWLQHKNELAMELQSSFAKLLRKIFQYSSKKVISMEQIKDFLDNYLNLEQIRFENEVQIDFQIEEELLDIHFIPPLLIQPIIENSFKHGLFHKPMDKKLKIHLKKEGNYVYCCVEDNGVGRPAKMNPEKIKRSSGLTTTKKRLFILQHDVLKKLHPHDNFKVTDLKDSNGTPLGTRVELWIPFVTQRE